MQWEFPPGCTIEDPVRLGEREAKFRRSVFEATTHEPIVISSVASGQEVSLTNFRISVVPSYFDGCEFTEFLP